MRESNPLARAPARHHGWFFNHNPSLPGWRVSCSLPSLRLPSTFDSLDQIGLPVQLLDARVEHAVLTREQVGLALRVGDADRAHVLDLAAAVAILRDRGGLRQFAVES